MKFSIILPVRNGGHYVKECINSILMQTYTGFNLIVLDNASTDGTLEWIRSIKDERVVIHPSAVSLSIEDNWARITSVPKNEFITSIGHDDILLPGYLEEMNRLIEANPGAALYQTHFTYIDAQGMPLRECKAMKPFFTAAGFLEHILTLSIDINGTGFMLRSSDYDAIGGIPLYPNLLFADFALWMEATRRGGMAVSPGNHFRYRLHQSMTTISTDEKFQSAVEFYVDYLHSLKKEALEFNTLINQHAPAMLASYCKSFAHRLLRTPLEKRRGLTVKNWVEKCRQMAGKLIDNKDFDPGSAFSVKLAEGIDSTAAGRKLFLLFKKIYKKPVL